MESFNSPDMSSVVCIPCDGQHNAPLGLHHNSTCRRCELKGLAQPYNPNSLAAAVGPVAYLHEQINALPLPLLGWLMVLSSSTSRWVTCCPRTLLGPRSNVGAQRWNGLTTSYSGYVHYRQQGSSLISRTSNPSAAACRLLKQHSNPDRVPGLRSAQPGKQQWRGPMPWLVALSLGVLIFLGGPAQAAAAASNGFSLGGLLKGS